MIEFGFAVKIGSACWYIRIKWDIFWADSQVGVSRTHALVLLLHYVEHLVVALCKLGPSQKKDTDVSFSVVARPPAVGGSNV